MTIGDRWRSYWYRPGPLFDLAVCRVVCVASQLGFLLFLYSDYTPLYRLPETVYRPLLILRAILLPFGHSPLPPFERLPYEIVATIYWATIAVGVLALIGLLTNVSLALFAVGNLFLQAFRYSFRDYHHPEAILLIFFCLLALSPAGKTLSLDDLIAKLRNATKRKGFERFGVVDETHRFARWPLLLTGMLVAIAYLDAATKKLETGGLDWMNGYTLQYYLIGLGGERGSEFAAWIGQYHTVALLLSWVTMVWEATFFVVLIFSSLIWVYLPLGVGLHIGMCVTSLACFYHYIALYVVFVPWSKIVRTVSSKHRANETSSRAQVVFDGGCILCVRAMTFVQYWDWFKWFDYLDIRTWDSSSSEASTAGDLDVRGMEMVVVRPDGVSRKGFFAWREIVFRLPVLWPLLIAFHLPGASWFGPRAYKAIASSRVRFADCEEGTCSLQH